LQLGERQKEERNTKNALAKGYRRLRFPGCRRAALLRIGFKVALTRITIELGKTMPQSRQAAKSCGRNSPSSPQNFKGAALSYIGEQYG
jgi:hypothetical protein